MMINRIGAFLATQNTFARKPKSPESEYAKYDLTLKTSRVQPGTKQWETYKKANSYIIDQQLKNDDLTSTERKELQRDKFLIEQDLKKHGCK